MRLDPTALGIMAMLLPIAAFSVRREILRRRSAIRSWERARAHGLDEPVSLHPHIRADLCVGCTSCVEACPEGGVLQVVNGRAALVEASRCIGHGRCQNSCPRDAIELVFGTARRGVQIPEIGSDYQSNVPGLYIAGELGGMGLIRNAILQGVGAVDHLVKDRRPGSAVGTVDVAIIGAGPAGLAAALACRKRHLSYLLFDRDGLGGSILHYPRRKLVMTAPVELPIVGRMHFREVGKEELLEFWIKVVRRAGLELRAPECVTDVRHREQEFEIETNLDSYVAGQVVLAVGRRGTPRKLGVPGEDGSNVAYGMLEPERWKGARALVVGGGNSALEVALALAEHGAEVTLAHRGTAFHRAAPANVARLEKARGPRLEVLLESQVCRIEPARVVIGLPTEMRTIPIDQVFIMAGGEPPAEFLARIGVAMRWHHGAVQ
jgi:thioredoxin reductase/Pyruvate/2-oxoacid:ferredoxin oxidoreductase delta subunit